jgi:hypothetical protein
MKVDISRYYLNSFRYEPFARSMREFDGAFQGPEDRGVRRPAEDVDGQGSEVHASRSRAGIVGGGI